jgi:YD repeat-containing protein
MYDVVVLDKISYPGGEVRFEYKFDRIDCKQEPRLETVYINEAGSDQFKWSFIYDYFTANVSHYEKPTLSELLTVMGSTNYHANWNTKRLRLDEIKKTGMNNNQPQSHRFTYHNTGLPTKLSMAKDHWGYYNGKNNFSLIPLYTQNISQTPNTTEIQHGGDLGVDREAVELHNQAFILKEITYPAGGKTTFNYETNKYKTNDFENDPHKRDFMYLLRNTELITERGDKYAGTDWNKSEHFNLPVITEPNAGNSYPVTIRFEIKIDLEVSRFNRFLSLSIIDDTNKSHWNYIYPSVQHQIPQGSYGTYDTIMHMYTTLPPGNYSIKASGIPHFNNLNNCIDLLHVTVRTIIFPDAYLQENPFSLGGGLRIREIKSFDTNGAQLSGKRYTYTDNGSDSELQTSGRLMFYPRYRNNYNSHSSNGLRGGGYSVGYSKVHVADIDKNGNRLGKAVFEYINIPDQNLFYTWQDQSVALASRIRAKDENPSGIGGYKHSENGHILKETIYKNNVASPVRETEYEYLNFGSGPHIVWGILKSDFIDYYNSDCWQTCSACVDFIQQFPASDKAFGYLYPAIRPMQVSLHQKTETVYENNQPTTTITKYAYNSKRYVSKETLSSPTGVLTTVEYLYPNDLNGSTMNTLTQANRVNKPVEIKQTTNNAVSRTVHNYALFNNIPQISNIMTNTGTNRELETRIVYHQYDNYGNPQHISKDGTEQVIYLWGYKGQYPIAEIRGVTYSDVIANISETTLKAIAARDQPTSTDFTNINNLRTQLPNAEVTTYTYKRLVGVQSVIDPRNVSTNYNYDAFGRLQGITRAGKQEQRYEYRYRN